MDVHTAIIVFKRCNVNYALQVPKCASIFLGCIVTKIITAIMVLKVFVKIVQLLQGYINIS